MRNVIGETALLFTFRTAKEGGERAIETDVYVALNERAAKSGQVDLVDVEASVSYTHLDVYKRQVFKKWQTGAGSF